MNISRAGKEQQGVNHDDDRAAAKVYGSRGRLTAMRCPQWVGSGTWLYENRRKELAGFRRIRLLVGASAWALILMACRRVPNASWPWSDLLYGSSHRAWSLKCPQLRSRRSQWSERHDGSEPPLVERTQPLQTFGII